MRARNWGAARGAGTEGREVRRVSRETDLQDCGVRPGSGCEAWTLGKGLQAQGLRCGEQVSGPRVQSVSLAREAGSAGPGQRRSIS